MTAPTAQWEQIPSRAGVGVERSQRHADSAARRLLAVLVAATGPTVMAFSLLDAGRATAIGAALVLGAIAPDVLGASGGGQRWQVRLGIWLAVGLAVDLLGLGEVQGLWTVGTLVLADWAIRHRPPLPLAPVGGEPEAPTVVMSSLAAWQAHDGAADLRHLVFTALALVFTALSGYFGPQLVRVVDGVADGARRVVTTVLLGVVGVGTIAVPWFVQRLLAIDPITARARPGWSPRARGDVRPSLLWAADPTTRHRTRGQRVRAALVVPLVLLLLVAVVIVAQDRASTAARSMLGTTTPAVGDAPWWPDYQQELEWAFFQPGGAVNPLGHPSLLDIHSRYINIKDGVRVTWRPPPCSCRRLTVWAYGGSTMMGWGQRDDHTIPSELARIALEHGIHLDVVNHGVPSDLNWSETNRYLWDLAAAAEPPDLVIFYDGSNEVRGAVEHNNDREVGFDPKWPVNWAADLTPFRLSRNRLIALLAGRAPDGAGRDPIVVPPHLGPTELGTAVATAYDRGRQAAMALGTERGIPTYWFWQPDRYSRPPIDREPRSDPELERTVRVASRTARAHLPVDVHDISDTFAVDDGPIYIDDVHTSERGAAMIAERLFSTIEPRLVELAGSEQSR